MGDISGIFFQNQKITSKGLGAFSRCAMSDGVLQGCELSYSGAALVVSGGYISACGRLMSLQSSATISVSGATSGYARVCVNIDLSETATTTTFEQADFSVDYAATATGFSSLTQNDVNMSGTAYSMQLCIVALGAAGITDIVVRPEYSRVRGIDKLWEGSWSSGNITVAKTGGSSGCTGKGNISDYDFAIICIGTSGCAITKVGSTIRTGSVDANASSVLSVFANVFSATLSGNKLTMYQSKWVNLLDTSNSGSNTITAIYGLALEG